MDDAERLIGSEEGNEHGTNNVNQDQNNTNQTPQPPSSFTLLTNEGASSQPSADAFRPRPVASLNGPPGPGGIAPPSYQQAIQMEPIPTENKESVPDEPPPEYSDPPPGYNSSQSGGDRFMGESTMSTAEEQERANQVEDEIGRLIILSTVVQALEERERQNGTAPAGQNTARGPGQNSGRVPARIIRIPQRISGPTPAAATSPVYRSQVLANGRSINGTRAQPVRQGTNSCNNVRQAWATYRLVRCCIFLIVVIIVVVGGGIGASTGSSSGDDDSYDTDNYYGGHSDDSYSGTACLYFTCHNGGTCKTTGSRAYCSCTLEYKGTHCEDSKCFTYCHNGGTCRIRYGLEECECLPGYEGKYCADKTRTRCTYNRCHNGGTCWATGFRTTCGCRSGYSGDYCQDKTRTRCSYNRCHNGGTCWLNGFRTTCDCPLGYSGDYCQDILRSTTKKPIDCDLIECLNGGRCEQTSYSVRCICPTGTFGDRCQGMLPFFTTRKPSRCEGFVCENSGYCYAPYSYSSPECVCRGPYYGSRCQFMRTTPPGLKPTEIYSGNYSTKDSGDYSGELPYSGALPMPLLEPYLLFSDEDTSIKAAQLDGTHNLTLESRGGAHLDFDYRNQTLFFAEVEPVSKIFTADLETYSPEGADSSAVLMTGLYKPFMEGFAYDWVHKNLYWTDSGRMQITVMNTESLLQTTLLKTRIGELSAVVVDPRENQRWLYFIGENLSIHKVGLDGSQHSFLVHGAGASPHALTIDFKNNRLYWVNTDQHSLQSSDLDGKDIVTHLTSPTHLQQVFSIVQYGDFIYWSHLPQQEGQFQGSGDDLNPSSYIKRLNISDLDKHVETVMSKTGADLGFRDIKIFDGSRQPEAESACGSDNGGCSYLCLPVPYQTGSSTNYTCACPDGMNLGSNRRVCV